mgnify:CR=1 FL=1
MIELVGTCGMLFILFAFLMNQIHKWSADYVIYDIFNFIGGFLLFIYAIMIRSYPFLILNGVWMFVSLRDIIYGSSNRKKSRTHIGHKKR